MGHDTFVHTHTHAQDAAYHFVAYVPVGDKVFELDGLQKGPVNVGTVSLCMDLPGRPPAASFDTFFHVALQAPSRLGRPGPQLPRRPFSLALLGMVYFCILLVGVGNIH